MKTLGKLLTLGMISLIGLGTPNLANAQYEHIKINNDPSYVQKIKDLLSNPDYKSHDYRFDLGLTVTDDAFKNTSSQFGDFPYPPTFYRTLVAGLDPSEGSTRSSRYRISFMAFDRNNDGFYDYLYIQNDTYPFSINEQFNFNKDTKTIDYYIGFYPVNYSSVSKREDEIIGKTYRGITQDEAKTLGTDFIKRINDLTTIPNNTGRFSKEEFDEFLIDEKVLWMTGKDEQGNFVILKTGVPLNKVFSKEQLEKLDDYIGNAGK